MKRKSVAFMLIAALTASMFAGCGAKEDASSQAVSENETAAADGGAEEVASVYGDTYPLQNAEGKAITYYTRSNAVFTGYKDYTESPFHTKLAENVGVDIQFEFDPDGTTDDSNYNLVLTRPTLPDVILNEFHNASELLDDGVIIPLNDYLEKWAPNLNAYLEQNPEIKKAISTDDGTIYMFPWLRRTAGYVLSVE